MKTAKKRTVRCRPKTPRRKSAPPAPEKSTEPQGDLSFRRTGKHQYLYYDY